MADGEDDPDFGSHFLDSMLEVQMTEEDKELDVSRNCDPLDPLPHTPRFDLHSETLTYKDVYTPFPQPVLAGLPMATSTPAPGPLLLKPSPMVIYSGEVVPGRPAPVLTPVRPVRPVTPKPVPKPATRNVKVGASVDTAPEVTETFDKKFVKQVFLPEFVRNVFVKPEPPRDIANVSDDEMKYYITCFKDVSKVQSCRLHCTICDKHLGCAVTVRKKINVHSMLKVLTCKPCFEFYGDGNFPCDKGDNCEIYCRWCGQGGALVCCSYCPRVFCKKCVKRNFGPPFLRKIEKATDWACFCCAQKPLWPHRAVCRALLEFIERRKSDSKVPLRDTTWCCGAPGGLTRKRLRGGVASEKNKSTSTEPEIQFNPPPRTGKTYPSPKTVLGKDRLLEPVVRMRVADRVKIRPNSAAPPKPKTITNIFSPRSIITGNNIIRGIATTSTPKVFSAFPSPAPAPSPHVLPPPPLVPSDPLLAPSPRILLQANPPPTNPPPFNSCVKVSLTHQAPSLDVNKIPTVKVPQLVQGLFLRLILPDNKMQYVRLMFEGVSSPTANATSATAATTTTTTTKDFPMPQFKEKGSFVEENLAEAFKMSKTMYEKLMRIKEKVSCRNKLTEKSVFNSSVKKLHADYENAIETYRKLDRTLLERHEEWKREGRRPVDVIDLSDDEGGATAKRSKSSRGPSGGGGGGKDTRKNEDSDIEILDDVAVNGKTPNSNFKEKYRLRSSTEQGVGGGGRAQGNESGGVGRKRKRGRLRNTDKRLKVNRMQNGQPEEDPLKVEGPEPWTEGGTRGAEGGES